jgi:SAM-dependent methyltransferase
MTEWFARWFGEDYLKLYPHRDAKDAENVVGLIDRHLEFSGSRVLDLACGPGRHTPPLEARGAIVTGFDLSRVLLDRASEIGVKQLVRGDMRALPFASGSFETVVNLFTSFGYFETDEEHKAVLQLVHNVLVPGGGFAIDFLNPGFVRKHLVPEESTVAGGHEVDITREITGGNRFVQKTMRVRADDATFVERVRLYDRDDLRELLVEVGFEVKAEFGSYEGDPINEDAPRTILIALRS